MRSTEVGMPVIVRTFLDQLAVDDPEAQEALRRIEDDYCRDFEGLERCELDLEAAQEVIRLIHSAFADRLAGICTEPVHKRTREGQRQTLLKLRSELAEAGVSVSDEMIDVPLTPTEAISRLQGGVGN